MEIKDLELAVELADVRGGSVSFYNDNTMSATQSGPVTTVSASQGGQLLNSGMSIGVAVNAPQSITQSNATAQSLINSGNLDAHDESHYFGGFYWPF
jgi:hypothetical protein